MRSLPYGREDEGWRKRMAKERTEKRLPGTMYVYRDSDGGVDYYVASDTVEDSLMQGESRKRVGVYVLDHYEEVKVNCTHVPVK